MTNQTTVREIYLSVINATIESVRNELTDKSASESALESLDILKARWSDRLTQTHDFTDDPALVDKSSSSARAAKKSAKKKGPVPVPSPAASPPTPASSSAAAPAARNGVIPVAALTNAPDDHPAPAPANPLPAVPRVPPHLRKAEDIEEVVDVKPDQPPAKRARVAEPSAPAPSPPAPAAAAAAPADAPPGGAPPPVGGSAPPAAKRDDDDDGVIENVGEDLDSDDSDVQAEDSDEEAENLVLAQHDRVRKGNKWKVILKEGIVCIRGREYLFNKATCDLDF